MKLNKYIHAKLNETWPENGIPTEEDVDDWISDWYMSTFKDINCGDDGNPRAPPMWLCGPRWYDRRKRMIKEAEEASYEKDE
tara:strand:- start:264 stop:509 length:246 start_codon:yes stop_codon:yes gene_type:complete